MPKTSWDIRECQICGDWFSPDEESEIRPGVCQACTEEEEEDEYGDEFDDEEEDEDQA